MGSLLCSPLLFLSDSDFIQGTIALVEGSSYRFESLRIEITRAQNEGALAVLLQAPEGDCMAPAFLRQSSLTLSSLAVPGRLYFFIQQRTTEYLEIPCFSLLSKDFAKVKLMQGLNLTLNPSGRTTTSSFRLHEPYLSVGTTNAWREAADNLWFIIIYQILAAFSAATTAFSILQLVKYLKGKLGTFDLAVAALGFDIVGLIITTSAWALDPSGSSFTFLSFNTYFFTY